MSRRRNILFSAAVAAITPSALLPTRATAAAPPILAGISFVVSFIFQRYSMGTIMRFLARLAPSLFASERRKYFIGALMAFGIDSAVAAAVAEAAELAGAENVAFNGKEMTTELHIENRMSAPLELPSVTLVLADAKTDIIEVRSTAVWGLVVPPETSTKREIVASNFPRSGLKRWHLMTPDGSIARSGTFWVA